MRDFSCGLLISSNDKDFKLNLLFIQTTRHLVRSPKFHQNKDLKIAGIAQYNLTSTFITIQGSEASLEEFKKDFRF